ncbi:MAG TPA: hypothetical protein VL100_11655 [Croceibacterium sp.]|nr:hypothetical protein [Croceibacterium sp.]
MRVGIALAAMGAMWGLPAHAAGPQVEGAIYLERGDLGERLVEPASELRSGDKVVLLVRWRAAGDRDGFTVTTPVPSALAFQRDSSDTVEVSVDGGRSWARPGRLKGARPEQVTHLRWKIGARQAAQGSGSFAYSAFVR